MSSLHISCPSCGSPNDLGMERCHLCGHPLSGKTPSKSVPQPSISWSRLSRRTILWGVATGAVALATGGYLMYRRLTDPHILTYAENGVLDATWSPDGMRVASTSGDDRGAVQIWNATTGEKLATYTLEQPVQEGLPGPLLGEWGDAGGKRVVWSADGKHVLAFVGSLEKQMVQVWNAASGQRVQSFPVTHSLPLAANGGDQPKMTAWALNERYLAVAKTFLLSKSQPFVEIWDIAVGSKISVVETNGQDSGVFSGRIYGVDAMVWAPDREKLALCYSTEQGFLSEIWDATSGKKMPVFRIVAPTNTMVWSPDGKSLAVGTVIWDVETGNKVTEYTVEGRVLLAWSPEGKRVAVASYTGGHYWVPTYGNLFVFDASSGEQMAKYDQGRFDTFVAGMGKMAWSPNGKELLVLNGRIDLWKMEQR
jgi:WD40 repeat protein